MVGTDAARLKGRVRKRFRQNNPDAFTKANGDIDTVTELGRIEARGQKVKQKAREHFQRHKEPWVAKEAIRLWKNHAVQTAKHPAPEGAVTDLSPEALMHKARQNVQARAVRRLGRINDIKTRMQNAVIRNKEQQSPQQILTTPGLKQEFRRKGPEKQRDSKKRSATNRGAAEPARSRVRPVAGSPGSGAGFCRVRCQRRQGAQHNEKTKGINRDSRCHLCPIFVRQPKRCLNRGSGPRVP